MSDAPSDVADAATAPACPDGPDRDRAPRPDVGARGTVARMAAAILLVALTVPYGRSRAEVDGFLAALRAMLDSRPAIAHDRTQLGVQSLGGDGLQVALTCYLLLREAEEVAARQALMLDILALADRMGMSIGKGHTPPPPPEPVALAAE